MQDWNEVYPGTYYVRGKYSIQYNGAQERHIVRRDYNTSNPTITGCYKTVQQARGLYRQRLTDYQGSPGGI